MESPYLIYILEDDPGIQEIELYFLTNEGYHVEAFDNGKSFLAALRRKAPDAAVIDIMLPDTDGIELVEQMKRDVQLRRIPILMATAKIGNSNVIRGLNAGADDYLEKPFDYYVFLARVKALLRRSHLEHGEEELVFCDICIRPEKREVLLGGERVEMTEKEYALLLLLMWNAERTVTREQLMDQLWGTDYTGESRTLDMHMARVRKKLEGHHVRIRTVWGVGYRLEEA